MSDGAKSDCGNIGDILSRDNKVAVCDPVYPVYVDSNALEGRAGEYDVDAEEWTNIHYMPTTAENGFCPPIPEGKVDVYSPVLAQQPHGDGAYRRPAEGMGGLRQRERLADHVRHGLRALHHRTWRAALHLRGGRREDLRHRVPLVLEDRGLHGDALRAIPSFPKALVRNGQSLNDLWMRRQSTKFNGASYIIQKGAAAIYTDEGARQVDDALGYYRENARKYIKEGLEDAGLQVFGAVNSPYVWCKSPDGMPSWDFFDLLLEKGERGDHSGAGFGPAGEGYIRLTAFGDREATKEAVERIKAVL